MQSFNKLDKIIRKNIVGKGENAGYLPPYSFKEKLYHLSHIEIVVCKCHQF